MGNAEDSIVMKELAGCDAEPTIIHPTPPPTHAVLKATSNKEEVEFENAKESKAQVNSPTDEESTTSTF